jgi:hypothetical protein
VIWRISGQVFASALFFLSAVNSAKADPFFQVLNADRVMIVETPFSPRAEICLRWAHSVTGGPVADCFENRNGALTLTRSYLHDFAAGLGEVLGRGTLRSAEGGGYWIDGIDEQMPAAGLRLRVGPPRVGHALHTPEGVIDLSAIAANTRVTLQLGNR